MRPESTAEGLAKLPPYFRQDGVVTAGNASGITDGAAALVIAGADYAAARGLRPLGRLVSWGVAGVDPAIMGIGPAPAARKALLTDRNRRWSAWVEQRLNRPGTVLMAVGAGHLVGDDAVPAMLAAEGYKVVRVQ